MSARARLPAGEPRKASQRGKGRTAPPRSLFVPPRQQGDPVRWRDRSGVYRLDVGDGEHTEIAIDARLYRKHAVKTAGQFEAIELKLPCGVMVRAAANSMAVK